MNPATINSTVRELDCRTNDHIEVRLLWNSLTDSVSVSVHDTATANRSSSTSRQRTRSKPSATHSRTPSTTATPGPDGPGIYPPAGRQERTSDDQP